MGGYRPNRDRLGKGTGVFLACKHLVMVALHREAKAWYCLLTICMGG
jgi:hypothetical protein